MTMSDIHHIARTLIGMPRNNRVRVTGVVGIVDDWAIDAWFWVTPPSGPEDLPVAELDQWTVERTFTREDFPQAVAPHRDDIEDALRQKAIDRWRENPDG